LIRVETAEAGVITMAAMSVLSHRRTCMQIRVTITT
jgi:hypothetical protein